MGTPLIHIAPIPGCEMKNMEYFGARGMCIEVGNDFEKLDAALEELKKTEAVERMTENQKKFIARSAAADICALAERLVG